jgi:hypothetical protein
MALQTEQFLHFPDIIQLDELVPTGRGEPVPIIVPCHPRDGVLVPVQGRQAGPRPGIPQLDEVVLGPAADDGRPGMPLDRLDVPPMSLQDPLLTVSGPIPDSDRSVVPTRDEFRVTR